MGKKTRTRRTKWRRLSLGDASGPEEEDDEQQTEEIEVELKLSSDNELSVCGKEPYQSTKKSVQSSAENQKTYQEIQEVNTEMPSHEESSTSTRPSSSSSSTHHPSSSAWKQVNHSMTNGNTNHHQQYDKTQGRSVSPTSSDQHQSTSPHNQNQHQPQHQLGKGQGYYSYHYPPNGLNSYNGHTTYQSANQQQQQQQRTQFRRGGPHRYGSNNHPHSNGGSNGYGRANSWTNTSYNGSGSNNGCEPPKSHGIEKKIFNDEEYTKISTPRQEVLFKKGSIGKKRSSNQGSTATPTTSAGSEGLVNSADNDDSLNGNTAFPTTPTSPTGDACNDGASTGDASSTAGETSPDTAAQNYDGAPVVCFPMYDLYGGYGAMYSGVGGMLVQAYPGGPLVAAVPVPVPVQPVDWYRAPNGEVSYVYALAYPNMAEQAPMEENSPRSNSVESFQACSNQEINSEMSMGNSENSSPCSTGPSSQGPASPQNELASPNGMDVAKSIGVESSDGQKMAAVTGYIYPATGYAVPPAPVYATESGFGSCVELCNRTSSFCSVAICRDTFVSSTPVDAAIVTSSSFSSGADKTVAQSKSQAITKLCGSGKGTGGTGASAGSDTLNKRKKRKKKRKRRPAEMQIPWVTNTNYNEGVLQTSGDEEKESAQLPATSISMLTSSLETTNPITSSTTALNKLATPSSEDKQTTCSDPCPSDSSTDLETDLTSSSNQRKSTDSTDRKTSVDLPDGTAIYSSPKPATSLENSSLLERREFGPEEKVNDCLAAISKNSHADQDKIENAESCTEKQVLSSVFGFVGEEKTCAHESHQRLNNKPCIDRLKPDSITIEKTDGEHIEKPTKLDSPIEHLSRLDCTDGNTELKTLAAANALPKNVLFNSRARLSFDSLESESLMNSLDLDAYEEDSLEDEGVTVLNPLDDVRMSGKSDGPPHISDEFECLSAGGDSQRSLSGSATLEGFETLSSDLIIDLLEQLQTWPEMCTSPRNASISPTECSVPHGIEATEESTQYDSELIVENSESPPPPSNQLWKTVILEESEPDSLEISRRSSLGKDCTSVTVSRTSTRVSSEKLGPISSAVFQWLDSAPIQVQLKSNADLKSLSESEAEIDQTELDDTATVSKNESVDPRTAPSSEDVPTPADGPQRRVDANELNCKIIAKEMIASDPQQLGDVDENFPASASNVCDPTKYSIYYHLGVSLDDEEEIEPVAHMTETIQASYNPNGLSSTEDCATSWCFEAEPSASDATQASIICSYPSIHDEAAAHNDVPLLVHSKSLSLEPIAAADDPVPGTRSQRFHSSSDPTDLSTTSGPKHPSWRRTLGVLRAVQLLKKSPDKRKRLKSVQSCCAVQ